MARAAPPDRRSGGACCWCSNCGRRRARCTRRRSRLFTIASPRIPGRSASSYLPFGVRDGTWETGNFRPRTLFNQTRHGKALIGGYLSRVSPRRVQTDAPGLPDARCPDHAEREAPIGPDIKARLDERGDRLVTQGNVGYVVIDSRFVPSIAPSCHRRAQAARSRSAISTSTL